jgi:hypothetical protein
MVQSSYSQSVDSLPLKELNNEFLKGISAREKLHTLKQIAKLDSIQLSLYKDSIVPNLEKLTIKQDKDIVSLETKLEDSKQTIKFYRYLSVVFSVLTVALIFSN